MRTLFLIAAAALVALLVILFPPSPPVVRVARFERNPAVVITGPNGQPARYRLEEFGAAEAADQAAASFLGDIVRADLGFEDALRVVPAEAALPGPANVPEADGLITARLVRSAPLLEVEVRIVKISTGEEAFARGYRASPTLSRLVAHTIGDEILLAQAGIKGVARTRLAFVSDRGGMRRELGGMLRRFKEVWIADYDGANEKRVTSDGDLDMTPSWSPDGTAVAYTSMKRGPFDIFVSFLDGRRVENPTRGVASNSLPAWSPDASRIAFTSTRDGNSEIYVMNRDGADLHRLTRHPAIDTAPAWSPDGARIAFTSGRSGSPQIWTMNADGSDPRQLTSEKQCDRASWSPPPYDEIAYVSRTTTGFDIKVIDVATGAARQLTFGQGFNESPAYAPNGRHIAFSSTRRHGEQIWTIARTGGEPRQVTTIGNNSMPAWSR